MIKIAAFVPEAIDGCAWYRGLGVLNKLRYIGNVDVKRIYGNFTWADISDCDIAFMQRPHTKQHVEITKFVSKIVPLWIDYDDDLTQVPPSNPNFWEFSSADTYSNINSIRELASLVTCSTPELSKTFGGIHVPNAYNDYDLSTEYKEQYAKVILWRGSSTHVEDIYDYRYTLLELANKYSDFNFHFMGQAPWVLGNLPKNVTFSKPIPMLDYLRYIGDMKPAITIVPLADNNFNRAKSNIAWLETARTGAGIVAPAISSWNNIPFLKGYKLGREDSFFDSFVAEMAQYQLFASKRWDYIKQFLLLSHVNMLRLELIRQVVEK